MISKIDNPVDNTAKLHKIVQYDVPLDVDSIIVYLGKEGWKSRPHIGTEVILIAVDGTGNKRIGVVSQEFVSRTVKVRRGMGWDIRREDRYEIEITFPKNDEKGDEI